MPNRFGTTLFIVVSIMVCATNPAVAQAEARDDENMIRGLMRDKLYEAAADRVFEFVFKYPNHPRREALLYEICDALIKGGKETKAVPLLRCYLQEFPGGRWRMAISLMLARGQVATGDYAAAVQLLETVVSESGYSSSDQTFARNMLAELYLVQGRYQDTAALLRQSVTRGSSAKSRLLYARALRGSGEWEGAERMLQQLLGERRGSEAWEEARAELAFLFLDTARYQDCVQLLSDWTPKAEENPNERRLILALTVSYYHLGDYERAFESLEKIWSKAKGDSAPANQFPSILLALHEWRAAAEILKESYAKSQSTLRKIGLGNLLVRALIASGNQDEAVGVLVRMAGEIPGPQARAELLLRAAELSTEPARSLEIIQEVLSDSVAPVIAQEAYRLKTRLLVQGGQVKEAIAALEALEALDGPGIDIAEAAAEKGEILLKIGDLRNAETAFRTAVTNLPFSPARMRAYPLLVRTLILAGKPGEAVEAAESYLPLLDSKKTATSFWQDLASAYSLIGRHREAAAAAGRALITDGVDGEQGVVPLLLAFAGRAKEAGMLELSEATYRHLLDSGGREVRTAALSGLIECSIRREDWQAAADYCQRLSAVEQDSWAAGWADFTLTRCLDELGRTLERDVVLTRLAERGVGSPFTDAGVDELKRLALESKRYDSALRADPQFNALNPDKQHEYDRLLRQAQRASIAGDHERAVSMYDQYPVAMLMPAEQRYTHAFSLFALGREADAYHSLLKVDEDKLLPAQQWNRLQMMAAALYSTGKTAEAHSYYKLLLERPIPPLLRLNALYGLAKAEETAGWWPEAKEHYGLYLDESKSIEPDLVVLQQIAESYASHGDLKSAAELYRRIELLVRDPIEAVRYRFRSVELREEAGEEDYAVEEYLKIAYQNAGLQPWAPRARLKAAAIFERQNRVDAALRQYEVVADRYPGTDEGNAAAQRLREIRAAREGVQEEQIKDQ
jgi:tetratricopeptide (TPR) repeat protein